MTSGEAAAAVKETGRVEAFSDGVFAIAITLLVLDLKVPHARELQAKRTPADGGAPAPVAELSRLPDELRDDPRHVGQPPPDVHPCPADDAALPLSERPPAAARDAGAVSRSALVAEHIEESEAPAAAAVYAGTYVAIAVAFDLLWRYAASRRRLLAQGAPGGGDVEAITRQYRVGPAMYLIAFVLAFVSVAASVGLCLALALYFSFSGSLRAAEGGAR